MLMTILRRLGLLISGALVVAVSLALVGFATLRPAAEPAPVDIAALSVGATRSLWSCAPAPTLPTADAGGDIDYDPDLGTGGGAVSTVVDATAIAQDAAPVATAGPVGATGATVPTAGTIATLSQTDVSEATSLAVDPTDSGLPLVAGVSVAMASAGDLRGLTAATCQQPVSSAYLVGGSTQLGSSARLVLSNPGETAATVTITGWGSTGPMPQVAPVVVPAGTVRSVLLERVSLDERVAVRIDVTGGRVVPTIQASSLNGIIAAGTDVIGTAADPTIDLLIGGVPLPDDPSAGAVLRLVNPGTEPATTSVQMLGADGAVPLTGAESTVIEAGTVVDISLAGVAAGSYGIQVTSDLPVTGAVELTRTGTPGEDDPDVAPIDVGWLAAAAPVDRGVLPVPTALADMIAVSVTNPGTEATDVAVTAIAASGATLTQTSVAVEAGATVGVDVPDGTVALVMEGDGFVAAQALAAQVDDGGLIAAVNIVPDPNVEQSVVVRVSD